ncbi:molybdopterin-dependent oxidoreductase [Streptomyces johnsoniae]|uniref:Molybdopterin-dependent oxidoreductase n=1 Tax=Streptomyces johnsoniae TaxID=3075532 RepID=A0ABU2S0U5_9ACTN|nr:molybdopterin-dependent oxidoreductase [Streptomyces sp. DSM 41886]MDT0442587.1 molybdopterin-dependent oxidoreductase [Streptomyces sp. DSM 41886]
MNGPPGGRPHSSHWGAFHAAHDADGLRVRPDPADPEPSPLLDNLPGFTRARVTRPHVRRGWLTGGPGPDTARGTDDFVPVDWAEVVPLLAGELDRVRTVHGNRAIFGGSYGWGSAGRFHHAQSQVHRFLNALGGYTRSVNTYSLGASRPLLRHVVGSDAPIAEPTTYPVLAEHTGLFVCFGGMPAKNAQVNAGGVSRHGAAGYLRAARARGARFVLVSPLRDDLADDLDAEWLAPEPGTDTALMLALAHVLLTEDRHDEGFLARHVTGFDAFRGYVLGHTDHVPKTPDWAAAICGIPAARIASLAREMAATRTMISLSWSLQRAHRGEQPLWAGVALAALLGQIGLPGGGFGHGYGATAGTGAGVLPYRLPTLPQGINPVPDFIPVARIADLLLNPGGRCDYDGQRLTYPDIRLVYWSGGNPFHHHQDLARLRRAFTRPDTVVVHEPYWTATARHADIVLPATTTLEREDIGGAKEDPVLIAMHRIAEPQGQARDDYAIFAALAAELGVAEEFTRGRTARQWLAHLYESWRAGLAPEHAPAEDFAAFWPAGRVPLRGRRERHTLYAAFRADPDAHPLPTPSGRIELFSRTIDSFGYDDCPGHPAWLPQDPPDPAFPLHLIANNPATRLHSQLDHGPHSAAAKIEGREPLRMHPADVAAFGLRPGEVIRVRSAVGSCLAAVVPSDGLRRGVVQLATGAWFDPSAPQAATCVHGNPNALTADVGTSRLAQGCTGQLARVTVERLTAPPPPVRAHGPA